MGIVAPPVVRPGMSANQERQLQNRYESLCRDVTTVITDVMQITVGLEERAQEFGNCKAYNLFVHDFGFEKIRFVNQENGRYVLIMEP